MSLFRSATARPRSAEQVSQRQYAIEEAVWLDPCEGDAVRFHLDIGNQCLWRQVAGATEERLLPAPRTFAVLRLLIERAGRLVTHEEFLEVVWPGVCVQPEVLKSQILALRSLLQDDARNPRFIETAPRRGYRFIGRVGADAVTASSLSPAPFPVSKALVGRERPLAQLRASLQRVVRHRHHQMVFVTGESGIGKTSLVEEFLRQMRQELPQARFAVGQCVEGYGGKEACYPMLEALRELCMSRGSATLLREFASCAPSWLAQIPALLPPSRRQALLRDLAPGSRGQMSRELMNLFQRVSLDTPIILVLEDLQWADPSTVSLLEVLARCRTPMPLMLIGTYRSPDLKSGPHPLRALQQELQAHQLCGELPLEPLTHSEIAAYLEAQVSGAAVPQGLATFIYRHTEGNPLFMVTLLQHLCQRGLVSSEAGSWQLHSPLHDIEFQVPDTLRAMIEARITRLSAEEQGLLEAASVAEGDFLPQCCAQAAGLDLERSEELCEILAKWDCILSPGHCDSSSSPEIAIPRYKFAHTMYREVLYRRQSPARRADRHLRVARWLESTFSAAQPELALALVHHLERAGRPQDADTYRLKAEARDSCPDSSCERPNLAGAGSFQGPKLYSLADAAEARRDRVRLAELG